MVFLRQQPLAAPEPANQAPFARVKAHLKKELSQGRWPPGSLMPSEPELVAQFQVSRMTVSRALRELQSEGLVTRLQGVGTFAAHLGSVSSNLTIHDLQQEIATRGHRHHAVVHLAQEEPCPETIALQFRLAPSTRVFHTLLVHFEDGVPMQCEDRYVNPACAPDYLQNDFTQLSPTYYLRTVAPLWEAQYAVEACLPTAQEAELLCIAPSAPCLVVQRKTANADVPITLARQVHPGARYQLNGHFKP
jgi:GntR family histidine utilization transcriptional repressor